MAVLSSQPLNAPARSFILAMLAASSLALGGCPLILGLEALKVSDWNPRRERLSASGVGEIWVQFSAEVDRTKAEQAFSVSENASPMSGSFTWSGDRLTFIPIRAVSDGNDYEIAVLQSAESTSGNSLAKDFRFAFSTRTETGRPLVNSIQPADGSRVGVLLVPVTVEFSEPIDQASFMAAWSVSPDPGGTISFSATGETATFSPLSEWKPATEYRIVIADSLKDLSGNRLAAEFRSAFTAGTESIRPTLLAVRPVVNGAPQGAGLIPEDPNDPVQQVNGGFEATWGFEVEFSEPVIRDTIESFIDLEPAWGFRIDPAGAPRARFTLVPTERLAWGSLYCLTIRRGVLDTSGNAKADDSVFFFRVDGASTRPPRVDRIRFRTNPHNSISPAYGDYTLAEAFSNLDLSLFTPGEDTPTYLDIYLTLADGASIDPFSLMHAVTVAATNGAALITPVGVATAGFADPQPPVIVGLTPARVSVSVSNTTNSGVITIGVSQGLADSAGNVMSAAFSLPLLK